MNRRLISTTVKRYAKFVDDTTSVTRGASNTLPSQFNQQRQGPPPVPVPIPTTPVVKKTNSAKPLPPILSLLDGKLTMQPTPPNKPRLNTTINYSIDDRSQSSSQLDAFLIAAVKLNAIQPDAANLYTLAGQMKDREGKMLDIDLKYESEPVEDRKINVGLRKNMGKKADRIIGDEIKEAAPTMQVLQPGEQDGVVTLAFIAGSNIHLCTGFAVGNSKEGQGNMIATVSHVLQQIITESPSTNSESAVLAITSTGHIFPVQSVLSSYLSADLLILSIAASPLRDPKYASAPSKTLPRLKTLPISPYPCRTGSPVGCFVYTAPTIARQWQLGRVVEYKDLNGRSVESGTYDELASMTLTSIPSEGSSGGPIIDIDSGAVVGVMRGSTNGYGDRQTRGFATPAEKLFELFRLPGFKSKTTSDTSSTNAKEKESKV